MHSLQSKSLEPQFPIKSIKFSDFLLTNIPPAICFFFYYYYLFIYLFIYFWLCWVFVSVRGLSPVAASGGHSSSRCAGLSLSWPLLLRSTGSRCAGSVVVAHGPSCSAACEIFPDQGSNPCPLHWQADSQPLHHQGSPCNMLLIGFSHFFTSRHVYKMMFIQHQGNQRACLWPKAIRVSVSRLWLSQDLPSCRAD